MRCDDKRRVEGRAGHRHLLVDDTHAIQTLGARREAIAPDPHDECARASNSLLTHQLRVTHDEVEAEAGFQRDVSASIDSDYERSSLGAPPGKRFEFGGGHARARHEKNRPLAQAVNRRNALAAKHGRPILRQVVLDGALESGE